LANSKKSSAAFSSRLTCAAFNSRPSCGYESRPFHHVLHRPPAPPNCGCMMHVTRFAGLAFGQIVPVILSRTQRVQGAENFSVVCRKSATRASSIALVPSDHEKAPPERGQEVHQPALAPADLRRPARLAHGRSTSVSGPVRAGRMWSELSNPCGDGRSAGGHPSRGATFCNSRRLNGLGACVLLG